MESAAARLRDGPEIMSANDQRKCPVCGADDCRPFLDVPDVPCHVGLLWNTRKGALGCPRGDLRLSLCHGCAFIFNSAFDPARMEYSQAYDNCLHYSGVYQDYAEGVARRLIEEHALRKRRIVEIGSGKGDFLAMLIRLGDNRGWGFDPSYDGRYSDLEKEGRLHVLADFFSERQAHIGADLICSRYVFEHIPQPISFLRNARSAAKPGTLFYFEVPNALFILRDGSIWDLIYEHCSYFTPPSLGRAFHTLGLRVLSLREQFEGQFLAIEAIAGNGAGAGGTEPSPIDPTTVFPYVEAFPEFFRQRAQEWREKLRGTRSTVVWGAGAKAVTFLNLMDARGAVDRVVDINPAKQGKFMAGTGQPIVAPEALGDDPPSKVIVMNPVYCEEIRRRLAELGVQADMETAL